MPQTAKKITAETIIAEYLPNRTVCCGILAVSAFRGLSLGYVGIIDDYLLMLARFDLGMFIDEDNCRGLINGFE